MKHRLPAPQHCIYPFATREHCCFSSLQQQLAVNVDLIEAWKGVDDVIVVDAVLTGAPIGTVQLWDGQHQLACNMIKTSTHGLGVAQAIELAYVLDQLPIRLRVYGIEGRRFELGTKISPQVQRAVAEVVGRIIADLSAPHDRDRPSPLKAGCS